MASAIGKYHKGAAFLAEVKRHLLLEGFCVAVPEPDSGDDLWVCDLGLVGEGKPARLLRCQLKGAWSSRKEGTDELYTVNLTKEEIAGARLSSEFFYLIGLYDPAATPGPFHLICLPSNYLRAIHEKGQVRSTNSRPMMLSFFLGQEAGLLTYTLRMKYEAAPGKKHGRGPRASLADFAVNTKTTIRSVLDSALKWNGVVEYVPIVNRRRPKSMTGGVRSAAVALRLPN